MVFIPTPTTPPGVFVTLFPGPQSDGVMIQILCGSVLVGFYREEVYSRTGLRVTEAEKS